MTEHIVPTEFFTGEVRVALVGCGGSGSQMLTALARLHVSLLALGHPGGLRVTTFDPDTVTPANIGRQLFAPADVGHPKATVLTHRLNVFYGLEWEAKVQRFPSQADGTWQLVIACVDTKTARRDIVRALEQSSVTRYYLDLGNLSHEGQVVLGQVGRTAGRLPHALELFPELAHGKERKDVPSCSLAESLASQSLYINGAVSTFAANLLYQLFTEGRLEHHGFFINLRRGLVRPIPVPAGVAA